MPDYSWGVLRTTGRSPERGSLELDTENLSATTPDGPVRKALGISGNARLLIPIPLRETLTGLESGPSLKISESTFHASTGRLQFIDIECTERGLEPVFADFAEAICDQVLKGHPGLRSVTTALRDFRRLFDVSASRPQSIDKIVGLLGELYLLRQALALDTTAASIWTGPGTPPGQHDFLGLRTAIEVKSSLRRSTPVVHISGIGQLEAPPGRALLLCHLRFDETGQGGLTVPDLADEVIRLSTQPLLVRTRLADAEFDPANSAAWGERRFDLRSVTFYRVEGTFPRIINSTLVNGAAPTGVANLAYEVDLSHAEAFRLPAADTGLAIENLVRGR
ncbi:MAG: PD-(D/E)XK motif protein [Verrucomicrobiaceae bacterium]|nr:MAG: PD-(D/E)XK motif protein [Verrucomicrobiaceae bacterium]